MAQFIVTRLFVLWGLCAICMMLAVQVGIERDNAVLTFKSERADITDIFLYDPATGMTHNITQSHYTEWAFAWSAEGDLLYTAAVNPGQATDELFTMSRLGIENFIETPGLLIFGGSWAPDGRTLAYFSSYPRNVSDIFTIRFPEATATNVTTTDTITETHPLWSPDGRSIMFMREDDLYLKHVETGETSLVADLEAPIDNPVWSPDGETIVFFTSSYISGHNRNFAYRIAPDGSDLHPLALPEIISRTATWSPDSVQIALVANTTDLLFYDLSDDSYHLIPHTARRYAPSWSPDGETLAFIEGRRGYFLDIASQTIQPIAFDSFVTRPLQWKP